MTWWRRLWHRKKLEEQLEKELRFHLDQQTEDLMVRGYPRPEARRLALLEFGGAEQVKENCRDARGTRWLEDAWHDFRYTLRALRQKPGFSAVALLTLALGTGATTVMFTVINGVLLKPLPFPQPDRLLVLQEKTRQATRFGNLWAFAYPNYLDCRREVRSMELAVWRFRVGTASAQGDPQYVSGREISSNLFAVLGVPVVRGRAFLPEEDRPGGPPAMIAGYSLWQRMFGGAPNIIGTPVKLDGEVYTIVGVASSSLRLGGEEPDLFTPLGRNPAPSLQRRDRHPGLQVVARLQPGRTLASARTELDVVAHRLEQRYPDSNRERSFVADPLRADVGDVTSTLWLLLGAVALVLLIACVNIASLLLARAVSRERELALRVALGASRGRLVRQCLTESTSLGIFGGLLGVALAAIGIRPFVALWPGSLPRADEVHIDWRVVVFAAGASLVSGLLFGLAPALRAPGRRVEMALRAGNRTVAGTPRRLHAAFVVSEIALAVVLLAAAGMLGRTMLRLSALAPGMDVHNVLVSRMALSPAALADPTRILPAWDEVLKHAAAVPGVESAAIVDTVPMREGNNEIPYWTSPAMPPPNQQPVALSTSVTPGYLKVMGIPLLRGRFFDDHDRKGSENVVVIDEVMAQQVFGGRDPVGERLWLSQQGSPFSSESGSPDPVRVVGVVGHVRHWGLAADDQAKVRAQFYYPLAQVSGPLLRRWSELMSVAVRTSVPPLHAVEGLRKELRGAAGDQALYEVNTMEQLISDSLARQRFLLQLFGAFAGLALILACTGIYGVLAYLTSRRVPEIGVRIALGASAGEVIWLVLRQSLGMILLGLAFGGAAAFAAGRVLQRLVEGMRPTEVTTLAIVIPVLMAAALFASFLPARRASRVDPLIALRQE